MAYCDLETVTAILINFAGEPSGFVGLVTRAEFAILERKRSRKFDVGVVTEHSASDVLADHGSELETLRRTAASDPELVESRIGIDDKIAVATIFVVAGAGLEQGRVLQTGKLRFELPARRDDVVSGRGCGCSCRGPKRVGRLCGSEKPRLSRGSAAHPVIPGTSKLGMFGNVKRSSPGGVPK